jgi:hypothetical protein
MDSNLWYRNTKSGDFRSIPGIAGSSSTGEGDVGGGTSEPGHGRLRAAWSWLKQTDLIPDKGQFR